MSIKLLMALAIWPTAFFYSAPLQAQPASAHGSTLYAPGAKQAFQYQIIPAASNTWGYDILKGNKVFIHQPNKPGLPGNGGFATKADAVKVAQLVIAKMKKGEMPPTVSPEELKALKLKTR